MARTQTDGGRSPVGRLVLLALTFAVGYLLGSQRGGRSEEWEDVQKEPTEITIDGDEDEE
ncbi:hypothetical protein [Halorussus ruber]|uniref:hypothetical protein n=1 Tax=Halorussus ruber TaxID=1126238 RepID=UPI0010929D1A|nr:hypothetical protein [Halorussus ruber]